MNEKKKSYKNIVKKLIVLWMLFCCFVVISFYKSAFFQEPNSIIIILATIYWEMRWKEVVEIPFTSNEYITTKEKYFLQFMLKNGYILLEQMGAWYFFKSSLSEKYIATSKQFTRHYRLFKIKKY